MTYGPMPPEYLAIPGLPVLSASEILDWFDGPLHFRAQDETGDVWLCSSLDVEMDPPTVGWLRYMDAWAYARHDAATAEDILHNRRPFRDLFTAARDLYRVEVTWLSTGGPAGQSDPTATATRSTPETIADGWLPDADVFFEMETT